MKTYDLTRFSNEDIHTAYHNKNIETKRSLEIESYIAKENDWIVENLKKIGYKDLYPLSAIDIGCDYGFQLYDLTTRYLVSPLNLIGLDLYPTDIFPEIKIAQINILDFKDNANKLLATLYPITSTNKVLSKYISYTPTTILSKGLSYPPIDLCILNHTLEHFLHPWVVTNLAIDIARYIAIALPKHGTPWATWDSHVSTWDLESLTIFMSQYPQLTLLDHKEETFRQDAQGGNQTEFWTIWENTNLI